MLAPGVWEADPARLAAAHAATGAGLGLRERRALRKAGGQAWCCPAPSCPREDLAAALSEAAAQLADWEQARTGRSRPRLPASLDEVTASGADCERALTEMRRYLRLPADPAQRLAALAADQDTAWKLPRLYEMGGHFDELGLGALLDELARRQAGPDLAAAAFDQAWYASILDQIRVRVPGLRGPSRRGALDEIAADFRAHDVQHLVANRVRVRRAWADRLHDALDQHPLQARVIRKQAALRRRHLPLYAAAGRGQATCCFAPSSRAGRCLH